MNKLKVLENILLGYGKICVAYSGGTDSDFLLNVAKRVLGNNVIAIIGNGAMVSAKDYEEAVNLAKSIRVEYYTIDADVFKVEEFRNNSRERCYFCKKNIMGGIIEKAKELGFCIVADGKNSDDGKVYRPGAKAAEEIGIVSPLFEAGFTKAEIRSQAKKMDIKTWNKASNSCLATRFPYNTLLTAENFAMVEKAEKLIAESKIKSGRVRLHGEIARIEMPNEFFEEFMKNDKLIMKIKEIGFKYVTLDLEGFRSGSMD
ncbi:MAG: ATP-dependent sacrificial sulfur transferase LarE [Lachnospiraceae bacterium]|nr:ATP-dependent sacrificial sulfur transferase LarE [Lachnospiraceae bacterium]